MSEFTPGPWRWEINLHSKSLHLVGGRPQYDLTVIDFERWGMSRATMRLRDTAHDGMNIMHRLHERADWIAPFAGREHHVDWCANVTHPDARLIAAAPELLEALEDMAQWVAAFAYGQGAANHTEVMRSPRMAKAVAAIAKATRGQA